MNYKSYLQQKGYSLKTIEGNLYSKDQLEKWLKNEGISVEACTYNDLMAYVQSLKGKVKQKTIELYLTKITHYFDYLKATQKRTNNPVHQITVQGIQRQELHEILSKQELEALFHDYEVYEDDHSNSNYHWFKSQQLSSQRNKVIIGLIVYQGLDTAALTNLQTSDFHLRAGKIHVPGNRKSNARTLKLQADQILDLMEYQQVTREELLQQTGKQSEQLLISTGKGGKLYNVLQCLLKQLKTLNPKVTSIRQLRASVITYWLKNYNLREVQYMAGHRYVSSTEAYLINDLDDLQEEVSKYHPMG